MKLEKLKNLEAVFLSCYPKGFEDEHFFPTMKKFKPEKLEEFAKEALKKDIIKKFKSLSYFCILTETPYKNTLAFFCSKDDDVEQNSSGVSCSTSRSASICTKNKQVKNNH